jgi:hypothetical protein
MMTVYADYLYYSETYLGTAIASSAFSALAVRASAVIDQITFGRAAAETEPATVEQIKRATCALAEELQRQDAVNGADGITSEAQGQYSVQYGRGSSAAQCNQSKLERAAKVYLASTYLMFAGFNAGERGGC